MLVFPGIKELGTVYNACVWQPAFWHWRFLTNQNVNDTYGWHWALKHYGSKKLPTWANQ